MNSLPEPEVLKVGDGSIKVYFESEGLKAELDQDLHDKSTLRAVAEDTVKYKDARTALVIYAYRALNGNGIKFAVISEADLPKLRLRFAQEKLAQKATLAQMLAVINEDCVHCAFDECPDRQAEYIGDLPDVDMYASAGALANLLGKMITRGQPAPNRSLQRSVESLMGRSSDEPGHRPPKGKRRRKPGHGRRVKHDTHVRRGKPPVVRRSK